MTLLDLTPAVLDIVFSRGDDLDEPIDFLDANGDPITLWADATFAAQARLFPDDTTAVDLTVDDSEWTASRRIRLQLAAAVTATLDRNYTWDLELTSGGLVKTRLGGRFCAEPDTTRS